MLVSLLFIGLLPVSLLVVSLFLGSLLLVCCLLVCHLLVRLLLVCILLLFLLIVCLLLVCLIIVCLHLVCLHLVYLCLVCPHLVCPHLVCLLVSLLHILDKKIDRWADSGSYRDAGTHLRRRYCKKGTLFWPNSPNSLVSVHVDQPRVSSHEPCCYHVTRWLPVVSVPLRRWEKGPFG